MDDLALLDGRAVPRLLLALRPLLVLLVPLVLLGLLLGRLEVNGVHFGDATGVAAAAAAPGAAPAAAAGD